MRIHGPTTPDDFGQLTFIGSPNEVQEGDILQAGGDSYAVRDKPKTANHFGKPATELVLCDVGAYEYEVPRGGEPISPARIIFDNGMQVRFKRTVVTENVDFGEEPEVFWELVDCFDEDDDDLDPDNPHHGHGAYHYEWRGKCRDLPKGMLVGINLEPAGKEIKPSCKIIDSVYPTGAVVFSDGTSFQSHPDKEWVGWLKALEPPVSQGR
jgi:hypothetical protein